MKKQISYFGDRLVKEDWPYSVYSIYTVIADNKLLSFNLRRAAKELLLEEKQNHWIWWSAFPLKCSYDSSFLTCSTVPQRLSRQKDTSDTWYYLAGKRHNGETLWCSWRVCRLTGFSEHKALLSSVLSCLLQQDAATPLPQNQIHQSRWWQLVSDLLGDVLNWSKRIYGSQAYSKVPDIPRFHIGNPLLKTLSSEKEEK